MKIDAGQDARPVSATPTTNHARRRCHADHDTALADADGRERRAVRGAVRFRAATIRHPTVVMIATAIRSAVQRFGARGCAERMAQEFGDHPEAAPQRMRWARQLAP
jgi:hypothetical protein